MRILPAVIFAFVATLSSAQTRTQDVIYWKNGGCAFTMDVFTPKTSNHRAVLWLISGGWTSKHEGLDPGMARMFTDKGFTVFEVVHGSEPKYTIPEILKMIKRAVRFVRSNATTYDVSPKGIGLGGFSSGGHLSLFTGAVSDDGDPKANDPVDRVSSRTDAIATFCAPTDIEAWVSEGGAFPNPAKLGLYQAFGVNLQTEKNAAIKTFRELSPADQVKPNFPPTLLVHGDQDKLVPVQQAKTMDEALQKANITHSLIIVPGGAHDGKTFEGGRSAMLDWFEKYLS